MASVLSGPDEPVCLSGPALATSARVRITRCYGDYEVLDELGYGGMGVVFKATQRSLSRLVAMKFMHSQSLSSPELVKRFRAEAEAAGSLDHPNIVGIIEIGQQDGEHYFSMKYIEGRSLADQLREGPMDPRVAARLIAKLAAAVQHAHERGILHRDIKPANVLLNREAEPHLADFGLGALLDEIGREQAGGTPAYMAPEQLPHQFPLRLTTRVDVYGLGGVLYHCLTGRPPLIAGSKTEFAKRIPDLDPIRPEELNPKADRDISAICMRCLKKDPAQRYESALALADDLDRYLSGEPILARPASTFQKLRSWSRKRPVLATLVVAAAVLIPAITVGAAIAAIRIEHRRREAQRNFLIQEIETTRLMPHQAGWFPQTWTQAGEAAASGVVSGENQLRDEAAALLAGLDARKILGLTNVGASTVCFDNKGERFLSGGLESGPNLWNVSTHESQSYQPLGPGPAIFGEDNAPLQLQYNSSRQALELVEILSRQIRREWIAPAPVSFDEAGKDSFPLAVLSKDGNYGAAILETSDTSQSVAMFGPAGVRVLGGFPGRLTTLAMDSDATMVAAADATGILHAWSTSEGNLLLSVTNGENAVHSLAFKRMRFTRERDSSPLEGCLLAAGDAGGRVAIWDLSLGSIKTVCHGAQHRVTALAFSPDGTVLAGGGRGAVKLWDVATGRLLMDIESGDEITGLAFSPDGLCLGIGTAAHFSQARISVWSIESDHGVRTLRGLSGQISKVSFSGNGRKVAALSDAWEAGVWDADTGKLELACNVPKGETADNAAFSLGSDGSLFAFSTGQSARVWEVSSGSNKLSLPLPPGLVDAFAFDGKGHLFLFRMETRYGKTNRFGELLPPAEDPRVCRIRDLFGREPSKALENSDFDQRIHEVVALPPGDSFVIAGRGTRMGQRFEGLKKVAGLDFKEEWAMDLDSQAGQLVTDLSGQVLYTGLGYTQLALDTATGQPLRDPLPGQLGAVAEQSNLYVRVEPGASVGLPLCKRGIDLPVLRFRTSPVKDANLLRFSRHGDLLAWGNADGTVTVCDLPKIRARLSELHLDW